MCSRGSVIPLWIDQIREGNPITITDGTMTRFIMSLDEAVDLVLFALSMDLRGYPGPEGAGLYDPDPGRGGL